MGEGWVPSGESGPVCRTHAAPSAGATTVCEYSGMMSAMTTAAPYEIAVVVGALIATRDLVAVRIVALTVAPLMLYGGSLTEPARAGKQP